MSRSTQPSPLAVAAAADIAAAPPPAPQLPAEPTRRGGGVRPVVVLGSAAALVGGITAVLAPFIAPGVLRSFGVPFNPTEALKLQTMLRHLPPLVPTQRLRRPVLDLGSGDGRVVVAAAKQGYEAVGYEFNPWLVLYSRFAALSGGVRGSIGGQ